jgi:hypothetical protein
MYLKYCNDFGRHVRFPCTWFEKFCLRVRFVSWRSLGVIDSNLHCSCTFVTGYLFSKFTNSVVCLIDDFHFGVLEWLCDACGLFRCVCEAGPNPAHTVYDFHRPRVPPPPVGDCFLYVYFLNCPCVAVRHISVNYPVYWNCVLLIFVLQKGVQIVIGHV